VKQPEKEAMWQAAYRDLIGMLGHERSGEVYELLWEGGLKDWLETDDPPVTMAFDEAIGDEEARLLLRVAEAIVKYLQEKDAPKHNLVPLLRIAAQLQKRGRPIKHK
jgi:hypothetical protein